MSRSTEESTSIERQREIIEQWASANEHTVVGWAEDVDVSGSIDPFETASLGVWLNTKAPEWDIVCAWKLDRLGRNAIQLNKLFGWAAEYDKTIVSCSENFDLSTWVGRLVANVIAGVAEGELEAIRERTKSSRRKLRDSARWAGGKPPYGYAAVKLGSGQGWSLEVDPESAKVVRRIVEDVIDGKPITRIAGELNEDLVPTPADLYALRRGKPTGDGRWQATPIRNMLRNKALRGYVHHKGETVRDDDGMPVLMAEPLVDLDEWEAIQSVLDRIQEARSGMSRADKSPLAGVAVCMVCESNLHHSQSSTKGYEYRHYRCPKKDTTQIPAKDLEELVEEAFLDEVGDMEVRERVWVPGDSQPEELREAVTAYDELTKAAGRAQSTTAKQRLQRQLDTLDSRIAELESSKSEDAHWDFQTTGGTYRSVWESSDIIGRRDLLRKSGITVAASITGVEGYRSAANKGVWSFDLRIPDDLRMQ